ncbi:MAG: hypothetical protein ACOZBL_04580 [Patescibacteria group bacterium]
MANQFEYLLSFIRKSQYFMINHLLEANSQVSIAAINSSTKSSDTKAHH